MRIIYKYNPISKFFFKKEDCSTIGLIRILTALVLLMSLINDFPFVIDYFSDQGMLSGRTNMLRSEFRFSLLDYYGSPTLVIIFYLILIIFTLMLLVGKFARTSAIISNLYYYHLFMKKIHLY